MKTRLELIKNYPIEALKNWGEYFGYPEGICKEMTDMVDCDWLNTKIGILDDFGFQMINFLIKVKNVPLQNIYFLVSEEDPVVFEKINKWYSNFVENEILQIYNINDMSFDLIIANPPFERSLHAKILQSVYCSCKNSKIVYLCPDSLLSGMSVNCVNARKCTEEALSNYKFLGPVDFEGAKPVVSLFAFDLHSTEKKTFEGCRNSKRSEEEKSIRSKIDSADCWDPHKLSKTYNFTNAYSKWDENKNGNFRDWLKQKLDFFNSKRVFIGSTSALYYKQIIQIGEYPSYVAAFFQFETVEEADQFREVIKDPLYSQILKIYSTNKRDLYPKQAKWPKSIEALNLTEKELEFVNGL